MTEAGLLEAIIDLARLRGWLVAHFRPAQTARGWRTPVAADGAGFPDLVLIHPEWGRLIVAECKSDRGRVTTDQMRWLAAFSAAGAETHVWRPADWTEPLEESSIGRVLMAPASPPTRHADGRVGGGVGNDTTQGRIAAPGPFATDYMGMSWRGAARERRLDEEEEDDDR
jgi:hypothetical protein